MVLSPIGRWEMCGPSPLPAYIDIHTHTRTHARTPWSPSLFCVETCLTRSSCVNACAHLSVSLCLSGSLNVTSFLYCKMDAHRSGNEQGTFLLISLSCLDSWGCMFLQSLRSPHPGLRVHYCGKACKVLLLSVCVCVCVCVHTFACIYRPVCVCVSLCEADAAPC